MESKNSKKFIDYCGDVIEIIHDSRIFKILNFTLVLGGLVLTLASVVWILWDIIAVLLGCAGYTWNNLVPPVCIIVILDAVVPILYVFTMVMMIGLMAYYLKKKDLKPVELVEVKEESKEESEDIK